MCFDEYKYLKKLLSINKNVEVYKIYMSDKLRQETQDINLQSCTWRPKDIKLKVCVYMKNHEQRSKFKRHFNKTIKRKRMIFIKQVVMYKCQTVTVSLRSKGMHLFHVQNVTSNQEVIIKYGSLNTTYTYCSYLLQKIYSWF